MQQQVAFGGFNPYQAANTYDSRSNLAPQSITRSFNQHPLNQASFVTQQYTGFQNFLRHPPLVARNLRPNSDGEIVFEFDSEKYSSLTIIACDAFSVTQNNIDIPETKDELHKRDLSLTTPLDPAKFYNEIRNSIILKKEEKLKIEDITSVEMMIIDSLEKVKKV